MCAASILCVYTTAFSFSFVIQQLQQQNIIGNKIHKLFLWVANSKEQSSEQKHLK